MQKKWDMWIANLIILVSFSRQQIIQFFHVLASFRGRESYNKMDGERNVEWNQCMRESVLTHKRKEELPKGLSEGWISKANVFKSALYGQEKKHHGMRAGKPSFDVAI